MLPCNTVAPVPHQWAIDRILNDEANYRRQDTIRYNRHPEIVCPFQLGIESSDTQRNQDRRKDPNDIGGVRGNPRWVSHYWGRHEHQELGATQPEPHGKNRLRHASVHTRFDEGDSRANNGRPARPLRRKFGRIMRKLTPELLRPGLWMEFMVDIPADGRVCGVKQDGWADCLDMSIAAKLVEVSTMPKWV